MTLDPFRPARILSGTNAQQVHNHRTDQQLRQRRAQSPSPRKSYTGDADNPAGLVGDGTTTVFTHVHGWDTPAGTPPGSLPFVAALTYSCWVNNSDAKVAGLLSSVVASAGQLTLTFASAPAAGAVIEVCVVG